MQVGRVPYFPGPHPHDPIAVVAAKDFPFVPHVVQPAASVIYPAKAPYLSAAQAVQGPVEVGPQYPIGQMHEVIAVDPVDAVVIPAAHFVQSASEGRPVRLPQVPNGHATLTPAMA